MHPSAEYQAEYQPTYRIPKRLIAVALALGAAAGLSACETPERENTPSVSATPLDPEARPSDGATDSPEVGESGTYEEFIAKINNASPDETGDVFVIDGEEITKREVSAFDSKSGLGMSFGASFDPNNQSQYKPHETEVRVLNAYGDDIEAFVANSENVFPDDMPSYIRAGMTTRVGTYIYDSIQAVGGEYGHETNVAYLLASANFAYRWEEKNTGGQNLFAALPSEEELATIYHAARSEVYNLPDDPGKFAAPDSEGPINAGEETAAPPDGELGTTIISAASTVEGDRSISVPINGEAYDCDDFLGAKIMDGDWCTDDDLRLFATVEVNLDQIAEESGVDPGSAALIAFYSLRAIQNGTSEGYSAQSLRSDVDTATNFAVSESDITAVEQVLGTGTQS